MSFKRFFIGKPVESFESAVAQLGLTANTKFVSMQQTHSSSITQIKATTLADTPVKIFNLPKVDACFTTQKDVFLSVKSADCLPILISGFGTALKTPVPFVAAAHAGRTGTNLQILSCLLNELQDTLSIVETLRTEDQKLHIWFGPAICTDCYQIERKTDTHYNLVAQNEKQILDFFKEHNLNPQNSLQLDIAQHCTLHEPEKYYSYRATGPGVNMNYSFIGII